MDDYDDGVYDDSGLDKLYGEAREYEGLEVPYVELPIDDYEDDTPTGDAFWDYEDEE